MPLLSNKSVCFLLVSICGMESTPSVTWSSFGHLRSHSKVDDPFGSSDDEENKKQNVRKIQIQSDQNDLLTVGVPIRSRSAADPAIPVLESYVANLKNNNVGKPREQAIKAGVADAFDSEFGLKDPELKELLKFFEDQLKIKHINGAIEAGQPIPWVNSVGRAVPAYWEEHQDALKDLFVAPTIVGGYKLFLKQVTNELKQRCLKLGAPTGRDGKLKYTVHPGSFGMGSLRVPGEAKMEVLLGLLMESKINARISEITNTAETTFDKIRMLKEYEDMLQSQKMFPPPGFENIQQARLKMELENLGVGSEEIEEAADRSVFNPIGGLRGLRKETQEKQAKQSEYHMSIVKQMEEEETKRFDSWKKLQSSV